MQTYDAAIIGGGISGLIAAIDLARANKSVIVLEKSNRLGGRGMTINKDGACFNLGGHALYRAGEAYSILQELGVKLEGGTPPADGYAIWQNRLWPLPGNPARLLSSRLLSWPGKVELGRFMLGLGKIDAAAMANISLRDWAERQIRDPMVRHIFYALCRTATYNKALDDQPVGPVIRQVQRSLKSGVLYVNGGWQTIVDQLRELAVRAGATIRSGKNVTEIMHNGAVSGLRFSDGETIQVNRVISTLSPAETYRLVGDADPTSLRRWKDGARPVMAACLDLCLKRLPVADRHFAIGLDQPVFFTNHSRVAKLSDRDTLVMHLIKYNCSGDSDPKTDERLLEQTMNLLHPDWQKEVVAKQFLPNMTVVHDYMHLGQSELMPGPAVPEIRGLYIAGDWASHGEMLADAAAASARRAAGRIINEISSEYAAASAAYRA
ncbi:phytoene desaturase family protein [Paenibacillus mesophilus]|uniref:phytoene desaturase family protein n=1 Tax=Paenibacillus mesophilus TaxID=2582849 RepID=UPI00192E4718|nr:FAD-dependent oxidoreductase [Paenibacillus mesophilus]